MSPSIFKANVKEDYYEGKLSEFMALTKPELSKDFALITLATEEARDVPIASGIIFNRENIKVSVTCDPKKGVNLH